MSIEKNDKELTKLLEELKSESNGRKYFWIDISFAKRIGALADQCYFMLNELKQRGDIEIAGYTSNEDPGVEFFGDGALEAAYEDIRKDRVKHPADADKYQIRILPKAYVENKKYIFTIDNSGDFFLYGEKIDLDSGRTPNPDYKAMMRMIIKKLPKGGVISYYDLQDDLKDEIRSKEPLSIKVVKHFFEIGRLNKERLMNGFKIEGETYEYNHFFNTGGTGKLRFNNTLEDVAKYYKGKKLQ